MTQTATTASTQEPTMFKVIDEAAVAAGVALWSVTIESAAGVYEALLGEVRMWEYMEDMMVVRYAAVDLMEP